MVRVALAGVGNCASALVQGIELYKSKKQTFGFFPETKSMPLSDIQLVLAFDVNAHKVGKDLADAIFVAPNCAQVVYKPKRLGAPVLLGETLDGLDSNIAKHIPTTKSKPVDIAEELRKRKVDVVVILVPTGSQAAAEYYATAALQAGCGVVNGMPALIANNAAIQKEAEKRKLPIIGDDIKSQIGATIIHRALTNLFVLRGATLNNTIQLDWGGDMDFCNLMSNGRYESGKRQSKTESVIANLPNKDEVDVQVSAVDYIPFLKNQKEAYTRLEGTVFGGAPVRIDVFMQVQDGYNSAGVLLEAIRTCAVAKTKGIGGVINEGCSAFNKKPPRQLPDEEAHAQLRAFLQKNTKGPK